MIKLCLSGRYNAAVLCGFGALFTLPLAVGARQAGTAPVTLRMKFVQDEITKYQMNMKMTMVMGVPNLPKPVTMPMNMTALLEQKVTKLLPGGGGEVVSTTTNTQTTMNGQPSPTAQVPVVTVSYNSLGKIISAKMDQSDPKAASQPSNMTVNSMMSNMSGVGTFLPPKPVRPGDTWTQVMQLPGITGVGTAHCTLIKLENVGRYKTARIRTVVSIPMHTLMSKQGQIVKQAKQAAMTMNGVTKMTTETNFAIAEGKVVRTAGSGSAQMNMTMNSAMMPTAATTPKKPASKKPVVMKMTMSMSMALDMIQ